MKGFDRLSPSRRRFAPPQDEGGRSPIGSMSGIKRGAERLTLESMPSKADIANRAEIAAGHFAKGEFAAADAASRSVLKGSTAWFHPLTSGVQHKRGYVH